MYDKIAEHYLKTICISDEYLLPSPCKNSKLLLPDMAVKVGNLIDEYCQYHEETPSLLETYRSNSLQLVYFNRGASKIKTNGMHHYGLAADLVYFDEHGNPDYSKLDYPFLRKTGSQMGLISLSFEEAHKQYITVAEQQNMRNFVNGYIKGFQSKNGLIVDGIVGKKTIAKIKEVYNV